MPEMDHLLSKLPPGRLCVLGFGNRLWRDDGAGSILAEALQACPGLDSIDGGSVPENYLEAVINCQPDTIMLADAADFGGDPGDLQLLRKEHLAVAGVSTHAGSARMLAEYLQARSGAEVVLLAIQPGDTRAGAGLSPQVSASLHALLNCLLSDIRVSERAQ